MSQFPAFQEIILSLQNYWSSQGCILLQPYHTEVGAGTFNPATFLRCLDGDPWRAAYLEPSIRPTDGRYGDNPYRLSHYYQFQVILKPAPGDAQDVYLCSLAELGVDLAAHDVRFVEDDWESPTLGAWGLGWEVWIDGMEITQFTYFQQMGGIDLDPVSVEITYGMERIAMYLQKKSSVFDLLWARDVDDRDIYYGDIYRRSETQFSCYNFETAGTEMLRRHFIDFEQECESCLAAALPLPAYDYVLKCSHMFNLLDSRGAISVTDRTGYIARVRNLARRCAELYLSQLAAEV